MGPEELIVYCIVVIRQHSDGAMLKSDCRILKKCGSSDCLNHSIGCLFTFCFGVGVCFVLGFFLERVFCFRLGGGVGFFFGGGVGGAVFFFVVGSFMFCFVLVFFL